ncbi:MAG: ABC transporter ATP-binding protein [Deltaproteobacteria bacterium]|nr:ABC transporter ATP-binding protein [Deltaproteobacteria bacterium]
MEPVLNLRMVSFKYKGEWVLKDIHLRTFEGEIVGVIGPNGSGKSTLLKVMDGVLKPQEGDILLKSRPIGSLARAEVAKEIAMVAQENYFRFAFSVLEVVLMGRFPHLRRLQFEGERDKDIALNALKATHALHLSNRSIHEISGGEKQRVLLARALAQEPGVVLLDEPTSFLDLKHKREVFRLISSLSTDRKLAVVLVSHDIDLIAQYCGRIVMMKDGIIAFQGPPEVVLTPESIEKIYDCPVFVDINPATGKPRVSLRG